MVPFPWCGNAEPCAVRVFHNGLNPENIKARETYFGSHNDDKNRLFCKAGRKINPIKVVPIIGIPILHFDQNILHLRLKFIKSEPLNALVKTKVDTILVGLFFRNHFLDELYKVYESHGYLVLSIGFWPLQKIPIDPYEFDNWAMKTREWDQYIHSHTDH